MTRGRKTLFVLLGSAILAVSAVVAGPAIAAAGQKAHTSGGGTTAQGKFQVSAKAQQEGVLGGASGQVGFNDMKLDVVCMINTATTSFIETQDPATGLFWDVFANDNGPASSSPADQLAIFGPFTTPICVTAPTFLGFDVTSGNLVINDATP